MNTYRKLRGDSGSLTDAQYANKNSRLVQPDDVGDVNTIGRDGECHCFMDHRSTLIASRPNLSCLRADEHWCRSIVPEGNVAHRL